MTDKMREEFETSPRFRGMDFTRSETHPDYYDSPYANGAWDGWKASREALLKKQDQEQEEFLAHLADFEPEDTFHD
ncbi:hypothetical protein Q1J45_10425 [Pseudomonas rhodesiae]|jgi:hypothetical protein|uniref:hypothetical protein n=1 Tax=Pseudomonas sp. TaxID=306 RepID=UPI0028A9750D|nr:hypothetical protein [Pseudomonas sp.]